MTWTPPEYVAAGEASSAQFNEQVVDNLNWIRDSRLLGYDETSDDVDWTGAAGGTQHEICSMSVTVDVAGRVILLLGQILYSTSSSGLTVGFYDGPTTRLNQVVGTGSTLEFSGMLGHPWVNPSPGLHTVRLVVEAGGNGSANAADPEVNWLLAVDLAAAP